MSLSTVQSAKHHTVPVAHTLQFLQLLKYLQQSFRKFWSTFNEIEVSVGVSCMYILQMFCAFFAFFFSLAWERCCK